MLTYESDPLEEDVTIAGPISPKLKVASSGTDSDFDVKLIDVYPDNYPDPEETVTGNKRILDAPPLHMGGYQQLLRGEPFRAKFRNSWEKPEPLVPEQNDGHQLHHARPVPHIPPRPPHHGAGAELVVPADGSQSADVHRHSRHATPEQFTKATEQVFHQKDAASGVEVLVMPETAMESGNSKNELRADLRTCES